MQVVFSEERDSRKKMKSGKSSGEGEGFTGTYLEINQNSRLTSI